MPVISRSNNQLLPANARASDVAAKAVHEVLPIQQQRSLAAIRVQGFSGILYNHLLQGRKCSCQSSQKQIQTRLDKDGKAAPGVVNQLLTGMGFDVSAYGSKPDFNHSSRVSPLAPVDPYQGVFDIVTTDKTAPNAHIVDQGFGDNGPVDITSIEDLVGDFDASHLGFSDAACGICFGTSFVGGYSPCQSHRVVLTAEDTSAMLELDILSRPFVATADRLHFSVVLPRGALAVEAFRLWNDWRPVPTNFTIDDQAINTVVDVLRYCDGRRHVIAASYDEVIQWTHLELQFQTSSDSAVFEFPRLSKGSDVTLLEQLDPFQIVVGPNVPSLRPQDIIVESTFGKTLVVQNSNWWNTRERNILGWECTVRVIQPQEIFRILPHRGRVITKDRTTLTNHDNLTGNLRT